VNNPGELALKFKNELKGCRTKDYAALYIALEKTLKIRYSKDNKAIYKSMIEYFGNFGNYKGFMAYMKQGTEKNLNLIGSKRIEYFISWLNTEK
jgi:hypothetical protein